MDKPDCDVMEAEITDFYAMIDKKMCCENTISKGMQLLHRLWFCQEEQKSYEIIKALLSVAPDHKGLQDTYISICMQMQNISAAVAQYEKIAQRHEQQGNRREQIATYQKILKLMPLRKDVQEKLTMIKNKNRFYYFLFSKLTKK